MQALDASSIIHGWDNYPIDRFPSLWKWLAREFGRGRLSICQVASDEVKKRAPDCYRWMCDIGVTPTPMTQAMVLRALVIKDDLGIEEDRYHGKGVGENDLLIIAAAVEDGRELVTNEEVQNRLPDIRAKCKIPAVCAMASVSCPCRDFLSLIKQDPGVVFEQLA